MFTLWVTSEMRNRDMLEMKFMNNTDTAFPGLFSHHPVSWREKQTGLSQAVRLEPTAENFSSNSLGLSFLICTMGAGRPL